MNTEWLKARQTRYGAYLLTYLVIIVAVLGATNWLAVLATNAPCNTVLIKDTQATNNARLYRAVIAP